MRRRRRSHSLLRRPNRPDRTSPWLPPAESLLAVPRSKRCHADAAASGASGRGLNGRARAEAEKVEASQPLRFRREARHSCGTTGTDRGHTRVTGADSVHSVRTVPDTPALDVAMCCSRPSPPTRLRFQPRNHHGRYPRRHAAQIVRCTGLHESTAASPVWLEWWPCYSTMSACAMLCVRVTRRQTETPATLIVHATPSRHPSLSTLRGNSELFN